MDKQENRHNTNYGHNRDHNGSSSTTRSSFSRLGPEGVTETFLQSSRFSVGDMSMGSLLNWSNALRPDMVRSRFFSRSALMSRFIQGRNRKAATGTCWCEFRNLCTALRATDKSHQWFSPVGVGVGTNYPLILSLLGTICSVFQDFFLLQQYSSQPANASTFPAHAPFTVLSFNALRGWGDILCVCPARQRTANGKHAFGSLSRRTGERRTANSNAFAVRRSPLWGILVYS